MSRRRYRLLKHVPVVLVTAYVLILCFPQVIYGHELPYQNMILASRTAVDESVLNVLDKAEARLAASAIYDPEVRPRIVMTGSSSHYRILSLYLGANSFGKSYPMLPTRNVFINRADSRGDLVFRDAKENNQRSLSGVIAHETTHVLIRSRYGYWRNLTMPTWKKEGYAEYVAGGSTLSHEEGVRRWKANPHDATGYQYFKFLQLVTYLLETERISVDDLFMRDFDVEQLEARVLGSL